MKCGRCGKALVYTNSPRKVSYFRCRKRADSKSCEGAGTLRVVEVEEFVYSEMCRKMAEFQTITGGKPMKANPKLTKLKVELAQVEGDIEKLLNTLLDANATLLSYANKKIEELDAKRQSISDAIAAMSVDIVSPDQIKKVSAYLDNWDNITFDDRRLVVDGLMTTIHATSENIQIAWKI